MFYPMVKGKDGQDLVTKEEPSSSAIEAIEVRKRELADNAHYKSFSTALSVETL